MSERLSSDLKALLGETAFVALAQEFGGTRLYVPHSIPADHEIVQVIGLAAARRLSQRFAPAVIRVPLARFIRARHYRAAGLSHARIARKLGLTETGVDKLFRRMQDAPAKGSKAASAQLSLFEN
jgi:DNA-binding transcriptional regulator LsrR (DeoR family)